MPSLTQSFAKKRRRDEDDANDDIHLAFPQDFHNYYPHPHESHGLSPRKIKPFSSPLTKRIRIATTEWADGEEPYSPLSPPRHMPLAPNSRHSHSRSPSATTSKQTTKPISTTPSTITTTTRISANVLAPCHICHRKPTKKTELDSYADCEGCGERTCYVCIRACLGWKGVSPTTQHREEMDENIMRDGDEYVHHDEGLGRERLDQSFTMEDAPTDESTQMKREETWGKGGGTGHRGRICSQCCVEEGPEGEVICLGCLGT